jgi:hypothetical protein
VSAAISPPLSISCGRGGTREGGGLWNRRADVYSLGRSRVCSPAEVTGGVRVRSRFSSPVCVAGDARSGWEGILLRPVFRRGGDEAKAPASWRNNVPAHPHPLLLRSGDRGELESFCTGVPGQRFVISGR